MGFRGALEVANSRGPTHRAWVGDTLYDSDRPRIALPYRIYSARRLIWPRTMWMLAGPVACPVGLGAPLGLRRPVWRAYWGRRGLSCAILRRLVRL